jgi:hypothetical protein
MRNWHIEMGLDTLDLNVEVSQSQTVSGKLMPAPASSSLVHAPLATTALAAR